MPGPIFAHFQTFSRKPNPAGQSVEQVVAEAERDPEFSGHVLAPEPPRPLFGDSSTFRAQHDAHVAARATPVRTKGHGVRTRAIRADRHTLATVVVSYPLTHEQVAAVPDGAARLAEWERRNVEWARARWGDQLRVVLAHDDEAHPHLHLWLLADDPGADATTLHPGKVAKAQAETKAKAAGASPRDAVAKGNEALKEAMTGFLDDYWQAVGVPCGLTRDGPKRARLTRAQEQARKAEVERLREAHLEAERVKEEAGAVLVEAEEEAGRTSEEAGRVLGRADRARLVVEGRERQVNEREVEVDRRLAAVEDRERALEDREVEADRRELAAAAREEGFVLAVRLLAEDRIELREGRLVVPEEDREALRPVWSSIGRAVRQLVELRQVWRRGADRVRDLLRRNRIASEFVSEAEDLVNQGPRPG